LNRYNRKSRKEMSMKNIIDRIGDSYFWSDLTRWFRKWVAEPTSEAFSWILELVFERYAERCVMFTVIGIILGTVVGVIRAKGDSAVNPVETALQWGAGGLMIAHVAPAILMFAVIGIVAFVVAVIAGLLGYIIA
jgi:hypothetical protein